MQTAENLSLGRFWGSSPCQLETADRLVKLVAIAAKAATIVIQLVQARNGDDVLPASFAFSAEEIQVLDVINKDLQGNTQLQKNPHRKRTLAWAAGLIAKLGGWTGYASHKPPGPITFYNGLAQFQALAAGSNMCRCPSEDGEGEASR